LQLKNPDRLFFVDYNVIAGLSNTDVQDGLKTNIFIMAPATSLPSGCG